MVSAQLALKSQKTTISADPVWSPHFVGHGLFYTSQGKKIKIITILKVICSSSTSKILPKPSPGLLCSIWK